MPKKKLDIHLNLATFGLKPTETKILEENRIAWMVAFAEKCQLVLESCSSRLVNAFLIAKALEESDSGTQAGHQFVAEQRDHSRYYRFVTALLTPFFQSDNIWRGAFRDAT